MESQPRLLDQMREVLRLKHLSFRTEKAYIGWVKRFILFHDKRHPKDMGAAWRTWGPEPARPALRRDKRVVTRDCIRAAAVWDQGRHAPSHHRG